MSGKTIVPVRTDGTAYEIHIGGGLLAEAGALAAEALAPCRAAILTDSGVAPLYGDPLARSLANAGFQPELLVFQAGESSKSLQTAGWCCEELIRRGFDRHAAVFTLGGGVAGDLGGFVAAIYYRGIPVIHCPTTVVAQVDSAIGGKTGVNAEGGKNLIGAFLQPLRVIADTDALRSLPARTFREGCAEIVKHALIREPDMLKLLPPDPAMDLRGLIARNAAIKASIVSADEREQSGERALLNFGHTLGHAIENAAGYGKYLHGEAISLGLLAACHLSTLKCGFPAEALKQLTGILKALDLPVSLPEEPGDEALLRAMRTDKKFLAGKIRFVLARKPGDAFLSDAVTEQDIVDTIAWLRQPR